MTDQSYRQHLNSSTDLVTTYEQIRSGFVSLALEKNRRATPFVEQARALKAVASQASSATALMHIAEVQSGLLTAAGVSDKAVKYLEAEDKLEAVHGLITKYLEPAGADFVEELVYRFLLTRGDALGGSMRNVGGAIAQRKLTRALLAILTLTETPYHWLHSSNNTWLPMTDDDSDIELHLCGISWSTPEGDRTLLFNVTVPHVKNNVDISVLDCDFTECEVALKDPKRYRALGELKGGIDPAGADEHWKTARTALERIRNAFAKERSSPAIFFVGAAIAKRMAGEIWSQLQEGALANAANLTDATQLNSLCRWIVKL